MAPCVQVQPCPYPYNRLLGLQGVPAPHLLTPSMLEGLRKPGLAALGLQPHLPQLVQHILEILLVRQGLPHNLLTSQDKMGPWDLDTALSR